MDIRRFPDIPQNVKKQNIPIKPRISAQNRKEESNPNSAVNVIEYAKNGCSLIIFCDRSPSFDTMRSNVMEMRIKTRAHKRKNRNVFL
jgi:hypothetical protein